MQKGYFLSVYVLVWCKNYVLKQQTKLKTNNNKKFKKTK